MVLRLFSGFGKAFRPPVRTIHHFACTGGTLFAKCISAMPQTLVLSEIDPLSRMRINLDAPNFSPTDLILQMHQSSVGCSQNTAIDLFDAQMKVVANYASNNNLSLVIRDHTHSHFCVGDIDSNRPSVKNIIEKNFKTLSVVTVRDPVDSYLSLVHNGWVGFVPKTFDEYCKRYVKFLDFYKNVKIIKYENLTSDPVNTMKIICDLLEIKFSESFGSGIIGKRMTGDSGRRGDVIEKRARRNAHEGFLDEVVASKNYLVLIDKLDYKHI